MLGLHKHEQGKLKAFPLCFTTCWRNMQARAHGNKCCVTVTSTKLCQTPAMLNLHAFDLLNTKKTATD